MDSKIAILIYAYNVEKTIQDIVSTCLKASDKVLVIDDGSNDGTLDLIRDFSITVIHNDFTLGKDQCMIRGFSYLQPQQPKAIICIDASEFYYFDEVEQFLKAGVKYPKHMIIGMQSKHQCLANFFISWLVGEKVSDFQSSIRLLPNNIVSQILKHVSHKKKRLTGCTIND